MLPADDRAIFTTSDGCPVAYALHGPSRPNAQRLALVHSLGLDASVWDGVVELLRRDFEVLTYDCRGHGRSGRQPAVFTAELFAADLAGLMDVVNWPGAIVAGCSMGGNVAQAFATRYPERTLALALIDTTAWYGEGAPERWQERAETVRAQGFAAMVDFQVARWLGDAFRTARPEVVRGLVEVFVANDLSCYAAACALLGAADSRPHLAAFRMPATVIVGEDDSATPVVSSRLLHESIAGSTLTIIPSARHLTPVECPDQVADHLRTLADRAARG